MNFGMIVRQALNKAILPWDAMHLEMAKNDCNFIIQDLWYRVKADWRQSRGTITAVAGTDEYMLSKYFDAFVKNTLQGPNASPRTFTYKSTQEFHRLVNPRISSSSISYMYTWGDMVGYDQQLSIASGITVASALATKTTNDVNVVSGSDIVRSDFAIFSLNDVGLRFQRSGDSPSYKIGKFIDAQTIQLLEKYRGVTGSNVAYGIGDVGIHVNISGLVSNQYDSEDVILNGTTPVSTTKSFTALTAISKSDRTGGRVVCVDTNTGLITVGTMAAGETEIERQTVLFWPSPGAGEIEAYRFYMHHPYLWLDSERILIPRKWHRLIEYKLEAKLMGWAGISVPSDLSADIARMELQFNNEAEDMSLEDSGKDSDSQRNLNSYFYDHSEVIG